MSREIKLRTWDVESKVMIYFDSITIGAENGGRMTNGKRLLQLKFSFWNQKCPEVENIWVKPKENYVLQQFTGLKDHKEVECYEGDIVRYFNLPPFEISYGLLGEVQFINGCFCIKCRDKSKGGNVSWITEFDELDYFEVVGNVMETPELLK